MSFNNLTVLKALSSKTRLNIIQCLREGVNHPEDIAKKLGMTRQSIDKHLLELHALGLVERSAVFPPDGRPKIVYKMSAVGIELIDSLNELVKKYNVKIMERYEDELESLDVQLAHGDIGEEVYLKRLDELKKKYKIKSNAK